MGEQNSTPCPSCKTERTGTCQRCGTCCRMVWQAVSIPEDAPKEHHDALLDHLNWLMFRRGVKIRHVGHHAYEIGFPVECSFLSFDSDGKALCLTYDSRPDICRRFPEKETGNCPGFSFSEVKENRDG